jgi:hypothetical protein
VTCEPHRLPTSLFPEVFLKLYSLWTHWL